MMGHLVKHGPLAVIVDAVSWQDYLGGIIQHHCSSKMSNHAVLVVGYNTVGTYCLCRASGSIKIIVVWRIIKTVTTGTKRHSLNSLMHMVQPCCDF